MPEVLVVGILVLGVLATLWTTLFALLQYQSDRLEDLDGALEAAVAVDVSAEYLLPKLMDKLEHVAAPPGLRAHDAAAAVYRDLRERLLLDSNELDVYITLCVERVKGQYRFHSHRYVQRRTEELCRQYVWRGDVLDRLLDDLLLLASM